MSLVDGSQTAYGLQEKPHDRGRSPPGPEDNYTSGAAISSTLAPNVGQPGYVYVDEEVSLRIKDRRPGIGSLDQSTASRLATPEDFNLSTTTKDMVGKFSTAICEDSRRTRLPKSVTFQGIRQTRRRRSSSSSGQSADGSGSESSSDESSRYRRYGGYSGRALPSPFDTPSGVPKNEYIVNGDHFDGSQSGGCPATPRHTVINGRSRAVLTIM